MDRHGCCGGRVGAILWSIKPGNGANVAEMGTLNIPGHQPGRRQRTQTQLDTGQPAHAALQHGVPTQPALASCVFMIYRVRCNLR